MLQLIVVSRSHSVVPSAIETVAEIVSTMGPSDIASVGQLEDVDAVLILGALENVQQAQQLGGVLSLAMSGGLVVISAPGTVAGIPEKALLRQLISDLHIGDANEIHHLQNPNADFSDYIRVFGFGQTFFQDYPGTLEALGWVLHAASSYPGAFFFPVSQGGVYYVPFQHVGDHHSMLSSLLMAVSAHWDRTAVRLPPFIEGLRLPGEAELDQEVQETSARLRQLEEEIGHLREFHGLLASASGSRFEKLCIRAMNVVLEDSGYAAEDRPETFDEDFWIVKAGEDYALVEAKGVNSNIRRQHVNQVDNHRETYGKSPQDLPGILIVNIFRNSDELEPRQTTIATDVIAAAVRQNVLVLRSWDLHQFLSQALSGQDVASVLLKHLQAGGGWLRVSEVGHELIT